MTLNPNHLPDEFVLWGAGDLAVYLGGSEDSFTGDLLRLIAKADMGNKKRLAQAFPEVYLAWLTWRSLDPPSVANLTAVLKGT